ncbi:hypothetical protein GpartN1_g7259.t1 [Galdieria partita]|uniref:Uncharacterized protein n=1 Tax=Galdieria partita TaxID=83374 RepID=A0A9C7Q2W1_9RHOD|nr:hypothetical protein GpartN1_g7259.t1 [Galdieria partita]
MEQIYDSLTVSDDKNRAKHRIIKSRLRKVDVQIDTSENLRHNAGIVVDLSSLSPPLTDDDCDTLAVAIVNTEKPRLSYIETWSFCHNRISSRGATKLLVTIRSLGLGPSVDFRDNPFIEYLGCRDKVSASLGLAPCEGSECPVKIVQNQIVACRGSSQEKAPMKALILDTCPIFSVSSCIVEIIGKIEALSLRNTRFSSLWCLLEFLRRVQPYLLFLQRLPCRKKQFLRYEADNCCSADASETSLCVGRVALMRDSLVDEPHSLSEKSLSEENFINAVPGNHICPQYPQFFSSRRFVDSSGLHRVMRRFSSNDSDSDSFASSQEGMANISAMMDVSTHRSEFQTISSEQSVENLAQLPTSVPSSQNFPLVTSRHSSQRLTCNTAEDTEERNDCSSTELSSVKFRHSGDSVSSNYTRWRRYFTLMQNTEEEEEEDSLLRQTPVCDHSTYCEFFIALCPFLQVINEMEIDEEDRRYAQKVVVKHFQILAYKDVCNLNILDNLSKRQLGIKKGQVSGDHHRPAGIDEKEQLPWFPNEKKQLYNGHSSHFEKCCLSALTNSRTTIHCSRICHVPYRARQFEYHPFIPELMAVGTVDGEVLLLDHERQHLLGCTRVNSRENETILALCWLPSYPEKLLVGSDHGTIQLLDISSRDSQDVDFQCVRAFENFELQTSLHANCTSQFFLTSGYSTDIGVYDIRTGIKVQTLKECHSEHINVTRFSNLSPFLFATSSFDRSIKLFDIREPPVNGRQMPIFVRSSRMGTVMVCFSPDDSYLLSSAIDNEVYQYTVSDGRLHTHFPIPQTRSSYNYTRSYYMNGKDYMITGSCEEKVVRIYSTMSGKLFREVEMNTSSSSGQSNQVHTILSKESPYIQSLRGDPFQPFSFSVLLSHCRLSIPGEIIKVEMLKSFDEKWFDRGLSCRGGA